MGDTERARKMSGWFNNKTLKAIALYSFDKCGNCVNRLKCAEEILSSGKNPKPRPLKFIVDTVMTGCPKTKFSGMGFVPREVGNFLRIECKNCHSKRPICVGYISEYAGYIAPEEKERVLKQVEKCLDCTDLENCVHYFMTQLGISKTSLMKQAFLMKFKNCSSNGMMTISLELPPDAPGNVGGTVNKHAVIKPKEEGKP